MAPRFGAAILAALQTPRSHGVAAVVSSPCRPSPRGNVRAAQEENQKMIERKLGSSGLKISAIGLGCMGMSEFYDPRRMDDAESIRVIHRYLEAGGQFPRYGRRVWPRPE